MFTFDDLVFKPHPSDGQGLHALITLPNGEVLSVTRGRRCGFVTADEPYEVYVCGEVHENMTSSKINALLRELQQSTA